jgi:hypothetical protein
MASADEFRHNKSVFAGPEKPIFKPLFASEMGAR